MIRPLFFSAGVVLAVAWAQASPVVTNVRSRQIPGTHKVEILYDLAAVSPCTVALKVSKDGGSSYYLPDPPKALSGDLGGGIAAGRKRIELDAGMTDALNSIFSKQIRFKVTAMTEPFQNGSFELPGLSTPGTAILVDSNEMAGWVKAGPGILGLVNGRCGGQQFDPIDGNHHLNFNGGDTATGAILSQTFATTVGWTYEVSFFVGRVFGSGGTGDAALTSRVLDSSNNVLHSQRVSPPLAFGYGPVTRFTFTATSSCSTLSFEDTSTVTVNLDVALDAVSVVPVQNQAQPILSQIEARQDKWLEQWRCANSWEMLFLQLTNKIFSKDR
jgi:hypothetical protein